MDAKLAKETGASHFGMTGQNFDFAVFIALQFLSTNVKTRIKNVICLSKSERNTAH